MTGQPAKRKLSTLGGGCFWCLEAVFKRIEGIESVASGYSGGEKQNPTYREVSMGATGHAEVIQIEYDPDKICFEQILEIFWKAHDPTTLNRQGADNGTQYRSIILYHDEEQKQKTAESKSALDASGVYSNPSVTEIKPFTRFYPAEDYHRDYYENNLSAPYCRIVIQPKLQKMGLE